MMPTRLLIQTVLSLLSDMYSCSVVALCPKNSANKKWLPRAPWSPSSLF